MVDFDALRDKIKQYRSHAKPSIGDSSAPVTVSDLNHSVDETAKILNSIIDVLENEMTER